MTKVQDYNLFMCCPKLNQEALTPLPDGYTIRFCQKNELSIWKAFPFDSQEEALAYDSYMQEYFDKVYLPYGNLFFKTCLFLIDPNQKIVGTCFIWKHLGKYTCVHWFKIRKEAENKGLGRALLSYCLKDLQADDYPCYLHTQPGSYRAIKLYTDFGFKLLQSPQIIDGRENQLEKSLAYLKEHMTPSSFQALQFMQYKRPQ